MTPAFATFPDIIRPGATTSVHVILHPELGVGAVELDATQLLPGVYRRLVHTAVMQMVPIDSVDAVANREFQRWHVPEVTIVTLERVRSEIMGFMGFYMVSGLDHKSALELWRSYILPPLQTECVEDALYRFRPWLPS